MLISCAVTAWLICVLVFANVKRRFSYDTTHIILSRQQTAKMLIRLSIYELRHEKTNILVSDLVQHKPGCTATEDG